MKWSEEKLSSMMKFSFGDSSELADELLSLVLSGAKTATCSSLRAYDDGSSMPKVGRQDIVLDGCGKPTCIIETTEVTIKRFCDVDEDFAVSEGEGTFEDWKAGHRAYFARNGGFNPEMELVCERFKLIHVF